MTREMTGYTDYGGYVPCTTVIYKDYDEITGNALFLNSVIVIDFRHKLFGVMFVEAL